MKHKRDGVVMAIVGFYELDLPENDNIGWFMAVTQTGVGYLLNYTPHIGDVGQYPSKQFYFDSESSAHVHAAGYYMNHGKQYAHETAWVASVQREFNKTDAGVESQVMEFE